MKKIGLIVAVEMDAVLRRYGAPASVTEHKGFKVLSYDCGDYCIYVLNTGAGEIAAAAGTQLLISLYDVDMIVNFGVVGGLTEEMAMARTCVVESVVHTDFDTSAWDGCAPGRYLRYPSERIPTTPALVERAIGIHPELKKAVCASADKFVAGKEKKSALHEQFGADICEMESAGIVLTCDRAGVPVLLIKTVSDGITGGAEEFNRELERSSEICLEITDKLIRSL